MVSSTVFVKKPWGWLRQDNVWIVVLIILAGLVLTGAVSAATPITGPVVITVPGDYYLANSIINSGSKICIDITVPNVVLDGKGQTIDGVDSSDSIGIRVWNAGMTLFNVVVKNIVVSDWGTGVFYSDVKNSQLEKVTVLNNTGNGIALANSIRNTIKTCTAGANGGTGIILYAYSDSNTLTGNTASANILDGIRIRFSSNNDLLNNKLLVNKGSGINFNEAGNLNTVTGNTITGNLGDGITIYKSSGNLISKNTLKYNVAGITLNPDSFNNEISQNTVQNSTYNGILLINNANNNMVMGNTFDMNSDSGIRIVRSGENTVINNYVRNNLDEGIYLWDTGTVSNVIVNNYFYNNKNAGVYAPAGANTWNLTQSTRISITGGKNSGGNSWGQPNGLGFSQITPATNGICNQPYTLATNNIDKLPLKWAKK
jgi:parallel beta-helix repeat protein